MINSVINRNISQISASVAAEILSSDTQGATFEDVLSEAIENRSSADPSPYQLTTSAEAPSGASAGITEYITVEIYGKQYRQPTDEFLTLLGYDVEILRANALPNVNLAGFATLDGVIPKYVVPLDMLNGTDYTRTLATPENLARTDANNVDFDAWRSTRNTETVTETSNTARRPNVFELDEPAQNISGAAEKAVNSAPAASLPPRTIAPPVADIAPAAEEVRNSASVTEDRVNQAFRYRPPQIAANPSPVNSGTIAAWVQRMLSEMTALNLRAAKANKN